MTTFSASQGMLRRIDHVKLGAISLDQSVRGFGILIGSSIDADTEKGLGSASAIYGLFVFPGTEWIFLQLPTIHYQTK